MIKSKFEVKLVGFNQNRFLEECAKHKINLKDYIRHSRTKSSFIIFAWQFEKAKKLGLFDRFEVEKTELKSFVFYFFHLPQRIGLLAGFLLFVLLVYFASHKVLDIKISTTSFEQTQLIQKLLKEHNIQVGTDWSSVELKSLESDIFANVKNSTNVVVKKKGSVLFIESGEKTESKVRHGAIVAPENCVVEYIEVARGTALKHSGDIVQKNQVIVAPNENNETIATVKIRVFRQASVAVFQFLYQNERTGKSISKSKLVWPWQKSNFDFDCSYENYEKKVEQTECFLNFILPLKKVVVTYFELALCKIDDKQAVCLAKEKAKKFATAELEVVDKISFEEREQNGQKFVDCFAETVIKLC